MPHHQVKVTDSEALHLAQGLRFIPAQGQTADPNLSSETKLWYQGPERYFDVFVERQNNKITWIQITFRGQYVEWKDHHIRTGNTNEYAVASQAEHPATKMLHAHEIANPIVVQNILEVLKHRPEDNILQQIVEILKK